MRVVGLKTLKNKLSEYVRLAAGGETVLITDREQVVAELASPQRGRGLFPVDAFLADAVRKGWVTPPTFVPGGSPPRAPIAPLRDLLRELGEDRAER